MSTKSEVVYTSNKYGHCKQIHEQKAKLAFHITKPLGVLPKNETKYEDMIDVLQQIQSYLPSKAVQRELKVLDNTDFK